MSSYFWWALGYEEELPEPSDEQKRSRHNLHQEIKLPKRKLFKKKLRKEKLYSEVLKKTFTVR